MTLAEMYTMLNGITGFSGKVAYYCFPAGEAPDLPFICYLETGTDNFAADGMAYHEVKRVQIELYAKSRDLANEALIEAELDKAGIYWERSIAYLDSENCYETIYDVEV